MATRLLQASNDGRRQSVPFGYELVVSLAGLDAILRADDPVVVTLELTPRMSWAMLEEVDALVLNTALETRLGLQA